ncbi:hypothetical protein ACHHYP_00083 [Achlya hypogyna]|uniref:M96 mating-specific protein family n=1 Tax=Achlya hypogyna TaxID=1202772 RepID=A0A1V9ZC81_ACHHY|nr:hypothetical protein ACHHYP_00083 [Achlya hypogyna]
MEILAIFDDCNDAVLTDLSIESLSALLSPTVGINSGNSNDESSPKPVRRRTKRRPHGRPKEELAYLRDKHDELKKQLDALHANSHPVTATPWQARAVHQIKGARRALRENARLKELLTEQLQVIDALERVLKKRPQLSTYQASEAWRYAILGVAERAQSIEQILAEQLERLESLWVYHGLFVALERGEEMRKSVMQSTVADGSLQLLSCATFTMPLDYCAMSDVIWNLKVGADAPSSIEVLERFGPDICYYREVTTLNAATQPTMESRTVVQRFVRPTHIVFVWRTILEDQAVPLDPNRLINNLSGWSVVHAKSETECVLQGCMIQAAPVVPPSLQSTVGALTEVLMQSVADAKVKFGQQVHAAILKRRAGAVATT